MKKLLTALLAASIAFSCFGMMALADGDADTANSAEETKQVESLVGMFYMQGESNYTAMFDDMEYESTYDYTVANEIAAVIDGTNRVPFYAITKDGKTYFDRFAKETFISEINYASKAGVDFVAYKYYAGYGTDSSSNKSSITYMNNQLKLHVAAYAGNSFAKQTKYAIVLDGTFDYKKEADIIIDSYLGMSGYLTATDGRPVVFVEWNDSVADMITAVNKKLAKAVANGVNPKKNDPKLSLNDDVEAMYVVALNAPDYATAIAAGCDAISWSNGTAKNGEAYTSMTANVEANWASGDKVVPNVVTGYDKTVLDGNKIEVVAKAYEKDKTESVRYSQSGTKEDYAAPATAEEFAEHLANAVNTTNKPAEFAAVMVYAWDDLTGGAILCPTKTDKTDFYDYTLLKAMRKYFYGNESFGETELVRYDETNNVVRISGEGVVTTYKGSEIISKVDADGKDLLAPEDTANEPGNGEGQQGVDDVTANGDVDWVLIGCIAGGVVVVVAAVIVILAVSKKKKSADKAE